MGAHVLNCLIHNIFDDMLVFGDSEEALLVNVQTVFQRFREKNVTLNINKIVIGFASVFVWYENSATGINMSKTYKKCNLLQ